MPSLRLVVAFVLAMVLPAASALATWSIVVVDLATGQVGIAIATCLPYWDLRPIAVVVVPGVGVAAAQSSLGPLALRQLIRDGLLAGTPAAQILAQLAAVDGAHQQRQYGIVGFGSGSATFTGNQAMAWAGGLTGQSGSLVYAIQGNVLAGAAVLTAAEQALLAAPGSLPAKLVAAMEAATAMGGDGRCSCSQTAPASCGTPPPAFAKASDIALMIVARPGDTDAPCDALDGCADGDYWCVVNVADQPPTAPDAVTQLRTQFTAWEQQQSGRPDPLLSTVAFGSNSLRADGSSSALATVVLRDANGAALGNSLPLTVTPRGGTLPSGCAIGPVQALANGSYRFAVTAGFGVGAFALDLRVADPVGTTLLWPPPQLQCTELFAGCGDGGVPAVGGGTADVLRINGAAGAARVVTVGFAQAFTIDVAAPPASAGSGLAGLFALWAHVGVPPPGPQLPLGGVDGVLCFVPAPFGSTPTLLLADSFGLGGLIAAPAAPWSLLVPGVQALLDVALQGVMVGDPLGRVVATNAVHLRIVPLPAPTIGGVTPVAPTPGQVVTVIGTNFQNGTGVAVAGQPVAANVVGSVQLTFVMPAGVGCDAPLVLDNGVGSVGTSTINRTPIVGTATGSGSHLGGSVVVVQGQHLLGCTVRVNGVLVPLSAQLANVLVGTLPPGPVGPTQFVVRNANGCQVVLPFTYL